MLSNLRIVLINCNSALFFSGLRGHNQTGGDSEQPSYVSGGKTSEYPVSLLFCSKQVPRSEIKITEQINLLLSGFSLCFCAIITLEPLLTLYVQYTRYKWLCQSCFTTDFSHARRNHPGDRAKALEAILPIVESGDTVASDVYCLCGRIYKDMFMSSGFTDQNSRDQACYWYDSRFLCLWIWLYKSVHI